MSAIPNSNIRTKVNGNWADRVTFVQADGDAIKVEIGNKGITENVYSEINAPANIETLLCSYTVPIGKKFDLNSASCSGDNIGHFTIKINGVKIQLKRSWWTNFNVDFDFREQIASAGDVVQIFVINQGNASADFNATIIGGVYDE